MADEYLPAQDSIVLGPTDEDGIWELTFRDGQSGDEVRIILLLEQLREMDAKFTGHNP